MPRCNAMRADERRQRDPVRGLGGAIATRRASAARARVVAELRARRRPPGWRVPVRQRCGVLLELLNEPFEAGFHVRWDLLRLIRGEEAPELLRLAWGGGETAVGRGDV